MLYSYTVFARVHPGYRQGVAQHPYGAPPQYGQLISEVESGVTVLHLWPRDFALSARNNGVIVKPLASLWRPEFSGVFDDEFGVRGLERIKSAQGSRWVLQRWLCHPMTYQQIEADLQNCGVRKPKEVPTNMPPSPPPANSMNPFAT